jgi:hypothetical protein
MSTARSRGWLEHLQDAHGPRFHFVGNDPRRLEDALKGAEQARLKVFRLDLSKATSSSSLMELVAAEMDFPSYFGKNWDALLDMMSDLSWWNEREGFLIVVEDSGPRRPDSTEYIRTFFGVVISAVERMRSWGTTMHAVIAGEDQPSFDPGDATGVLALCDHLAALPGPKASEP